MSSRIIKGSCHCGAISYSARIDLSQPTIRCNCSICTKARGWIAPIPAADFELSSGREMLTEYQFGDRTVVHCFCSRCGVKTHGRILGSGSGGTLIAVCVSTLDIEPGQFAEIQISFIDGRNDRMQHRPELTTYL